MVRIIGTRDLVLAPFEDEVHDMGDFLKDHPQILGEDVRIISRELEHGPDGRRLDFLVYDAESNQPGIVELKKDLADEKILLQTLRYADWLRNNPDTIRYQISHQGLDIDPEEIEDNIKIHIVAPRIAPVVAELAQYVQGFEFEFIQLQRFKDSDGEIYAVTSPLEVPNRAAPRTRARLEHDRESYGQVGVTQERLDLLDAAVADLSSLSLNEAWELSPRWMKNAIKFQTGGGRNVFMVAIRKRQDHRIRFCLGPGFDLNTLQLPDGIRDGLRNKPASRWWSLPLQTAPINEYLPLLRAAHSFVRGAG